MYIKNMRFKYNSWIKLLIATNWIILSAAAMLGPIYALFVEWLGGNLMDASISWAIFWLVAGVVVMISWKYSDQYSNKEYIVSLWYIIMGIGFILYTQVSSIYHIFAIQVVIWLWEAVYSPAFDAIYSLQLDKSHEWEERWAREAMQYFVSSIWAILWWILVTNFWFNILFLAMWCFCICSSIYLFRMWQRYLKK